MPNPLNYLWFTQNKLKKKDEYSASTVTFFSAFHFKGRIEKKKSFQVDKNKFFQYFSSAVNWESQLFMELLLKHIFVQLFWFNSLIFKR